MSKSHQNEIKIWKKKSKTLTGKKRNTTGLNNVFFVTKSAKLMKNVFFITTARQIVPTEKGNNTDFKKIVLYWRNRSTRSKSMSAFNAGLQSILSSNASFINFSELAIAEPVERHHHLRCKI